MAVFSRVARLVIGTMGIGGEVQVLAPRAGRGFGSATGRPGREISRARRRCRCSTFDGRPPRSVGGLISSSHLGPVERRRQKGDRRSRRRGRRRPRQGSASAIRTTIRHKVARLRSPPGSMPRGRLRSPIACGIASAPPGCGASGQIGWAPAGSMSFLLIGKRSCLSWRRRRRRQVDQMPNGWKMRHQRKRLRMRLPGALHLRAVDDDDVAGDRCADPRTGRARCW